MDSVYKELPLFKPIIGLVVDDDKNAIEILTRMLEKTGCEIESANSGEKALEKFFPKKYSFILMDVSMGKMSGYDTTKKIREIEKGTGTRVPIIAVTAPGMQSDREKCLESGMDNYLSKPIKKDDLVMKIAQALGSKIAQKIIKDSNFNK